MKGYVYKSQRKADTFVYLSERDGFGVLPAPIAKLLGALNFVLELELEPARKLARADPARVIAALLASGYYLQLPPAEAISPPEA
jgi:uncharacterized protein YcgL (UPF0745 family)